MSILVVGMSVLVPCRKASMSALSGEILFKQPGLLTHDGLGLALGHAGAHQLVDSRMCVKNQWCHGLDKQSSLMPSPFAGVPWLRAALFPAAIIASRPYHNPEWVTRSVRMSPPAGIRCSLLYNVFGICSRRI